MDSGGTFDFVAGRKLNKRFQENQAQEMAASFLTQLEIFAKEENNLG